MAGVQVPITTGLLLNLDAWDLGDTYADAAEVTTWAARTGANWTGVGASGKPLYDENGINGNPCIQIEDAKTQYMESATEFMVGKTEGEIFLVVQAANDPAANQNDSGLWGWNTADFSVHFPFTNGQLYENFGRANRVATGNPTDPLDSPVIPYNVISKSGEWTVNINGTQHYTTGTNTVSFATASANHRVGRAHSATDNFFGRISQVLVYDTVMSAGDRAEMQTWLDLYWKVGGGPSAVPSTGGATHSRLNLGLGLGF